MGRRIKNGELRMMNKEDIEDLAVCGLWWRVVWGAVVVVCAAVGLGVGIWLASII